MKKPFAASLAALLIAACGSDSKKEDDTTGDGADGSSGGDGCATFCTDAGYEGGAALMFNGNVTECICSGGAGSIGAEACDAYCGELDIPAEYAYDNASENKCVCDGTQVPSGDGASDGSDGSGGDLFETDGEGFPVLPADPFATNADGAIWVSVSDSNVMHLPNGEYVAPFNRNGSSGGGVSFLDPGFVFAPDPVIQVQVNVRANAMDGSLECEQFSGMLVRYGNPPSGLNQTTPLSCSVSWTFDASNSSYSGTIEAELGGGTWSDQNVPSETGKFKARFAYIYVE